MSAASRWRDSGHLERAVETAGGQEAFDAAITAQLDDVSGRLAEPQAAIADFCGEPSKPAWAVKDEDPASSATWNQIGDVWVNFGESLIERDEASGV